MISFDKKPYVMPDGCRASFSGRIQGDEEVFLVFAQPRCPFWYTFNYIPQKDAQIEGRKVSSPRGVHLTETKDMGAEIQAQIMRTTAARLNGILGVV